MKVVICSVMLLSVNFFCLAQDEITSDSPVDSLSYEEMYRNSIQELDETRQILFSTEMELAQLHEHMASVEKRKKTKRNDIKTLSRNNGHGGGFGALNFKYTDFRDKDILRAGGRGGGRMNRAIAIGLEGQGIIPKLLARHLIFGRECSDLGEVERAWSGTVHVGASARIRGLSDFAQETTELASGEARQIHR